MSRVTLFADIIVPVPVPNLFTYRIPFEFNEVVKPGMRVAIQFGRKAHYTGIIRKLHENPPKYQAKYIEALIDEHPVVREDQFAFWEWLSTYYMCAIGEVMNAALPAGLKLDFEHYIQVHPEFDEDFRNLSEREYLIAEAVTVQKRIKVKDVQEIIGIKTVQPIIKSLLDKRVIITSDDLREKYSPKVETFVRLSDGYEDDTALNTLLDELSAKSSKEAQLAIMMGLLQMVGKDRKQWVFRKELIEKVGTSLSPLNTLAKAGVLTVEQFEVNRIQDDQTEYEVIKSLSEEQERALKEIKEGFEVDKPVLLHGVTSSGKTEIYVKLIEEALSRGEQVLFMLPEIALTTQLISRLQKYFGGEIGVYHSRFSQNERVEVWNRVMHPSGDGFNIVMGARSSLFLPFHNLGLIVVDEEHENTFKQYDPAPRYHARDAAMVLAKQRGAHVVLGSATPAVESYWNAEQGKYHLVELHTRFGNVKMPEILCADIKREQREKTMKSHFSSFLLEKMDEALENKEQIILFQNRRGYTPMWQCEDCGMIPQCQRCDVSLTYHKQAHLLSCHYCGYATHPPKKCDACGSTKLTMKGFGTEKIEEELQLLYPELRLARMDLDTTRSKHSYQKFIDSFANREVDVLIGTQMVSKGLDFDNVALVGILNADQMLNFPDFRSFERSFQLMLQVAGRAGRKNKRGKVVIQTYNPDHWIIQQVIANDYKSMYKQEVFERKAYAYPPYFRLIQFTFKHKDRDSVRAVSDMFAEKLRAKFSNRVLGPQDPLVARVNNFYLKQVILKFERNFSASKVREEVNQILDDFAVDPKTKAVRIVVDVDPV